MRAVREALARAARVLVMSHRDPDGDALGACLGLTWLLRPQGREVRVHSAGPIPEEYRFLPGIELVSAELPAPAEVDLVVLLDCHQPSRTGQAGEAFLAGYAGPAAVVDHHLGTTEYGHRAAWLAPEYAATCQMLETLARAAGWPLDAKAADCLFVGLQTDTGSFRYQNATAEVFECAARLVRAGAAPWPISQEVYATRPKRLALLGRIMAGLEYLAGGRLVVGQASRADLAAAEADHRDLEDAVETLRGIPGVEVAVLLRERSGGGVKASLRARGAYDVARVAISLGGGGHKNAAGFLSPDGLPAVRERLVEIIAPGLDGGQ